MNVKSLHLVVIVWGIFLYRYTVYDLIAEGLYQVTLYIDLCLETNGPCTLEITVFKNTLLPKKVCKLYSGFINASKYVVAKSIIDIVEDDLLQNPTLTL